MGWQVRGGAGRSGPGPGRGGPDEPDPARIMGARPGAGRSWGAGTGQTRAITRPGSPVGWRLRLATPAGAPSQGRARRGASGPSEATRRPARAFKSGAKARRASVPPPPPAFNQGSPTAGAEMLRDCPPPAPPLRRAP